MRVIRVTLGVLLVLGGAWMLLMIFAFSTLSAGGLEDDSPDWWPTVFVVMFGTPETFILMAGMMGGVGLCLYRPGMRMTVGRRIALIGILAVLLGLFLRAAIQERQWMESRSANPDGTKHIVKKYRNWFGPRRTVETDEP